MVLVVIRSSSGQAGLTGNSDWTAVMSVILHHQEPCGIMRFCRSSTLVSTIHPHHGLHSPRLQFLKYHLYQFERKPSCIQSKQQKTKSWSLWDTKINKFFVFIFIIIIVFIYYIIFSIIFYLYFIILEFHQHIIISHFI